MGKRGLKMVKKFESKQAEIKYYEEEAEEAEFLAWYHQQELENMQNHR